MNDGENANIYRLPPPGATELRIARIRRHTAAGLVCASLALYEVDVPAGPRLLCGWIDSKTARALAKDLVAMADAAERAT